MHAFTDAHSHKRWLPLQKADSGPAPTITVHAATELDEAARIVSR